MAKNDTHVKAESKKAAGTQPKTAVSKLGSVADLESLRKTILSKRDANRPCIAVCGGTNCHALGNADIIKAFEKEVEKQSLQSKIEIKETGCPGFCEKGPIVVIYPEKICYTEVKPEDASEIVTRTIVGKKVVERLVYTDPKTGASCVHEDDIPFYKTQMRAILADSGKINPKSIEDYLAIGGYSALARVMGSMTPEQVVAEISKSTLRGRSGAGVSAGMKWGSVLKAEGDVKYVICNCHEGDPGAFADRRMMEGNPHNIIEGMIIGAFAMKATDGYIYVGDEFPITVENAETAVKQAEEYGLLGRNILGTGLNFTIKVVIDAGDYVCGEMSALMNLIEGKVGEPYIRYDHATEHGMRGLPTDVNNLQTFANVPLIINKGADWYLTIGTERSKGTRTLSLLGTINNTGLVEAPMGMSLRHVIYEIGGGIRNDNKFKAVLAGGPLGTFIPESQLDLRVDFDDMSKAGGSLGPSLVVIDDKTCIVDVVKYFLNFLANESCGKCSPCRDGLEQILKIMDRITEGNGKEGDIETLMTIFDAQVAALCPLGQTASSPARSAIKYFRDEFDAHIKEKRCPAGTCKILSPAVH
jgi:NADH:ubiquinone oxidoreductase subunit F (NADH-binding)/(2Fe-2S) ferredoxin